MAFYRGNITIESDVDRHSYQEWDRAIEAMVARIDIATGDASEAAARAVGIIAQGKLTEKGHSELTFSPAPPGTPPAMVSGELAASMTVVRSGPFSAMVGPTTKYGRIQELGGVMRGHPYMEFHKFFNDKITKFRKSFVELPARPYLEPATDEAVNSGRVREIYADFWAAAIEG